MRLRLEGLAQVGQENGSEGGGKGIERVVPGDKSAWGESWKKEACWQLKRGVADWKKRWRSVQ